LGISPYSILAKDKPEVIKTNDKEYNEEDTSDSDNFIKIRSGFILVMVIVTRKLRPMTKPKVKSPKVIDLKSGMMINCRLSKEHVRVHQIYQGLEKEDNVLESGFMAFHQTVVHRVLQELEDATLSQK